MHEELKVIIDDCYKLKKSIYENQVFYKANKEQEDAFYSMVDSFINRTILYMEKYAQSESVRRTRLDLEKLEHENSRKHTTFMFDKMKENLYNVYMKYQGEREKNTNFVAAIEPTIFYPIRIIVNKLYRELNKKVYDESLNDFFEENNI